MIVAQPNFCRKPWRIFCDAGFYFNLRAKSRCATFILLRFSKPDWNSNYTAYWNINIILIQNIGTSIYKYMAWCTTTRIMYMARTYDPDRLHCTHDVYIVHTKCILHTTCHVYGHHWHHPLIITDTWIVSHLQHHPNATPATLTPHKLKHSLGLWDWEYSVYFWEIVGI